MFDRALSVLRGQFADLSDATVASVAGKTSVVSGLTAAVGGLTATDIAAFGGLAVAVVTGIVGIIYKRRSFRIEREEAERRALLDMQDAQRRARLHELEERIKLKQLERLTGGCDGSAGQTDTPVG